MKFVKPSAAFLIMLLMSVLNKAFAQNAYIQTDVIKVAGVTVATQIDALPATSKNTSYVYLNGMGTTAQKVGYQQSPNQNDIIQIYQYDQYGESATSYLPYTDNKSIKGSFRSTAVADQQNYYINSSTPGNLNKVANDPFPFSQELFENSPLHRLLAVGSDGIGFQPDFQDNTQHFSTISYRNNTAADLVIISPASGAATFYPANALSVTDTKNADGVEVLMFKNSAGQVLLKRQVSGQSTEPYYDTYYVFNANGSTAYIIPPKAAHLIATGTSTNIAVAPLSNLIYAYTYDALGRVTTRKAPNTGIVSLIYDTMNRPILVQDGNQAASTANQWSYIKYDVKNRPVSQGIYTDNTHIGQANMQNYVNSNYGSNFYESRSSNAATWYYSNNCFPSQSIQQLAFAFYDDYDLTQSGSPYYSYNTQGLVDGNGNNVESNPVALTQGMLTMVLKRTVGTGLNSIWLSNVYFYDKRNNLIQVQSNNHLNFTQYAITDYKTVAPDFTGTPVQVKVTKVTGSGAANSNTVLTSYTYDQAYRPLTLTQQYNNQPAVVIASYAYNELGQLVTKNLGQVTTGAIPPTISTATYGAITLVASGSITFNPGYVVPSGSTLKAFITPSDYLQTLDYRYNIRNQLLTINNSALTNDGGITNNDNTDLFGMTYLYDGSDANLANATPSYSGKISAVKWSYKYNSSGSASNERSYVYGYDQLGQLSKALYAERAPQSSSTTPFNVNLDGFDESGITYDDDGNITALNRNYSTNNGAGGTPMDNLTYKYDTNNPDRLYQVTDAVAQTGTYGFNNIAGATSSNYYQYDADGNLTNDPYKGISISYNLINRTDVISIPNIGNSTINYTYSDAQTLLKKQVFKGGTIQVTTDYVDGFVYTNGTLSYFPMGEGRVVNANGTLKPEYIISDQQGNARFSFQDNGFGSIVIIQENSYYGFGAVMPNSLVAASPNTNNNNLYNGNSEWQNSLQNLPDYYQTPNRNYDPEIGRFIAVDLLAETSVSLTSYHYANNNPIMGNDPTGNCDPDTDSGCDLVVNGPMPGDDTGPPNTETGGGGGGDPNIVYSGGGVPSTPSSYGGTDNSGGIDNSNGGGPVHYDYEYNEYGQLVQKTTIQGAGDDTYGYLAVKQQGQFADGTYFVFYTNDPNGTGVGDPNAVAQAYAADNSTSSSTGSSGGGGGGGGSSTFDEINNGVGAFGVGWGVKGAMIDAAVTSAGTEATTALKVYGKVTDVVGVAGGVFAMGTSGYNMYNQYEQHHKISDIHLGDAGDFAVATTSVAASIFLASNPIGWAIGAGAAVYFAGRFVYQATHQETTQ